MKTDIINWKQKWRRAVIKVRYGVSWLPGSQEGQWLLMKTDVINWKQKWRRAVILVRNGVLWLLGWWSGQSISMKWPFSDLRQESDIRKSYGHLISKSKEVTASSTQFFFGSAADLAKSELIILPGYHVLSLIWHFICPLFHRTDCRLLSNEFLN